MCGFGGGHNLTLSSSSWGSGSGLCAASQKKKTTKKSFPGRCRSSHLDTPNQGRGCPKKLCLRAPWSQPNSASGGFSKGLGEHGAKWSVVPLECRPWSTGQKTMMLRPQVQWGQSVSIAPDDSPTLREASGSGRAHHQAPILQGKRPVLTSYAQAGWPGGSGVRSPSASPAGGRGVNSGWSEPG